MKQTNLIYYILYRETGTLYKMRNKIVLLNRPDLD